DFMDGQPLRYRLTDDGHFVLYSIGLDCTDDGGTMQPRGRGRFGRGAPPVFGIPQQVDLVWPRPASEADISAYEQAEQKAQKEEMEKARIRSAEEEKSRELSRRAR